MQAKTVWETCEMSLCHVKNFVVEVVAINNVLYLQGSSASITWLIRTKST